VPELVWGCGPASCLFLSQGGVADDSFPSPVGYPFDGLLRGLISEDGRIGGGDLGVRSG
jgi:hypothetical protein